MDLEKIGGFLASLRKERGMTQEQLGEKIGVTNKTISRWEKGNYLPPAEMLKALSELYGVSINEILSGECLAAEAYQEKAEENIRSALESSSFALEEKKKYFKKKWRREHLASSVLVCAAALVLYVYGLMRHRGWSVLVPVGMLFYFVYQNNQMMIYVEHHVYDPVEEASSKPMWQRLGNGVRILMPLALAVSVLMLADLGENLIYSMIPELNDGITIRGSFSLLFFGDEGWSRADYFRGFSGVLRATGWLAAGNLLLVCLDRMKK